MKNRYLIVFLFFLFCNTNFVKADDEIFWIERSYFDDLYGEQAKISSKKESQWQSFLRNICYMSDIECIVYCSNGGHENYNGNNCMADPNAMYPSANDLNIYGARVAIGGYERDSNGNLSTRWDDFYKALKYSTYEYENKNAFEYITEDYCASNIADDNLCAKLKEKDKMAISNGTCQYFWKTMEKSNITIEGVQEIGFEIILTDNLDDIKEIAIANIKNTYKGTEVIYDSNNNKIEAKDNVLYFYGKNENYNTFKQTFISKYNEKKSCPTLFLGNDEYSSNGYTWHIEFDSESYNQEKYGSVFYYETYNGTIVNMGDNFANKKTELIDYNTIITFENCAKLFEDSPELLDLIRMFVKIFKFLIPILLIVFGILDFGKAAMSSKEDEMKKAQGKFIQRVIIGVCIFLAPTMLKLLLEIANNVWGHISTDFCGIL